MTMKWVLWLFGLFAVAVASAFVAGHNEGSITVFWPPYRLDVSINFFVLVAALGFVFVYGVLRGVAVLLDLPRQARRWRLLQKERAVHAALLDALALMLTGRYVRARKAAMQALELEQNLREHLRLGESLPRHLTQLRIMADLVAAESAHVLRDRTARDQHLSHALAIDPQGLHPHLAESIDAARLSAARWTLGDREASSALRQLSELPHGLARRTLALRLRLKASRLLRDHSMAIETARLLTKHGAFSDAASDSLLRSLALSSLLECADTEQLARMWAKLTDAETRHPEVTRAAARRWLDLGGEPGRAVQWLMPQWQSWLQNPDALDEPGRQALATLFEQALTAMPPDADWLLRLERASQQWPQQAEWAYLSACVFMRHSLWGKAQQALERCAPRLSDARLRRRAWVRLAELAEQRGDNAAAALHWKKAAQSE
jgi:HemY protein